MPLFSKKRDFTRIFFATDIHGSEACFRKFINAGKFYSVDVLILGGDVTGKMIVPIVDHGDGTFRSNFLGQDQVLRSKQEIAMLEQRIKDSGMYVSHMNKREFEDVQADKTRLDGLFMQVMRETLRKWVDLAEERLRETGTICYMTGGNDDHQEVIDALRETEHVKNPDNKVVKIDEIHEMASIGWSNPTPWKTPRECSEEELAQRISKFLSDVQDMENAVFNFHVPPVDSTLDTCPRLDDSVYPPKPVVVGGQQVMFGAGSKAVREAIAKHQPLLGLHGHIHESRGMCKIGRTVCLNPGSEYGEGVLRGVIVNLGDKKVVGYQLTSG